MSKKVTGVYVEIGHNTRNSKEAFYILCSVDGQTVGKAYAPDNKVAAGIAASMVAKVAQGGLLKLEEASQAAQEPEAPAEGANTIEEILDTLTGLDSYEEER